MAISDLPYLHAAGDGGPRSMTQMVVIHATDNTAPASGEASYATHRPDQTSAHFYVDDTSAYRALPLDDVAYGCYPTGNSRSVQFELCGLSNQISDATMRQAAPLVAEVCQRYGIPIRKIGPADLVNGVEGICGHVDVTNAWHQGDHTDPGASFDWPRFISYIAAAANPVPQEDDMPSSQSYQLPTTPGESLTLSVGPQGAGSGLGPCWISVGIDPKNGTAKYRVAISDGTPGHWDVYDGDKGANLSASKLLWGVQLKPGQRVISIDCLPGTAYKGDLYLCVEYGR